MNRRGLRLLALSGSLRAASSNTAALRALAQFVAPDHDVSLFAALRAIPPFDPDDDGPTPPPAVAALRTAIADADALVISSPEYARGIAGAFKNALDWLVSGPEMVGKPVALINTSPRAIHAESALRLTLATMSARLIEEACVTIPLMGRALGPDDIVADADLAGPLRRLIDALGRPQ